MSIWLYKYYLSNYPDIAECWGVSDDQANNALKALSKKSIHHEDAIQKDIEELARDIAIIEPDPEDGGWWVGYLLE